MRREVHHTDSNTLMSSIRSQPLQTSPIWSLSYLGEHVRQNSKSSRPEVDGVSMQFTRFMKSVSHYTFFISNVPRKQNKHVLNISGRKIPNAVVAFNLIGVRKEHINASYDVSFSSDFSNSRYFCWKVGVDICFFEFL